MNNFKILTLLDRRKSDDIFSSPYWAKVLLLQSSNKEHVAYATVPFLHQQGDFINKIELCIFDSRGLIVV
jgi:hypothetical protein